LGGNVPTKFYSRRARTCRRLGVGRSLLYLPSVFFGNALGIGKQREDPNMSTSTVQKPFDVVKTSSSGMSEPTLPRDLRNDSIHSSEEAKG
jgi:hypothetical protein